jgi:hypothetical protein
MPYSEAMRTLAGIAILLCVLLAPTAVRAAEDGYYVGAYRGIDIRQSPSDESPTVAHLERLRSVRIEARERSWARVATVNPPIVSGWVPEGALRRRHEPPKAHRSTSSFFAGLAALFGSDDSDASKTAVLGVRGLDNEGDLGNRAAPAAEVRWVEGLHVSDREIADFVRQGRLNP